MRLTETMLKSLREMDSNIRRWGTTMAVPNEITGRALEARGLIKPIGKTGRWNRYEITSAGRAILDQESGDG